jgi:Protein of unknown function (DUF1806)
MQPISPEKVQSLIAPFINRDVYLHLETTNGSYAVLRGEKTISVGSFVRNVVVRYAEGLTDWEPDSEEGRLLLAGHDEEGRLMIAFQLSFTPFGADRGEDE